MFRLTKNFFLGWVMFVCVGMIGCLTPTKFTANIPKEPETPKQTNDNDIKSESGIVIRLTKGGDILFNRTEKITTIENLQPLYDKLKKYWEEKERTPVMAADKKAKGSRTVILVCDKSIPSSEVTKVIDVLKWAGADPVGLSLE